MKIESPLGRELPKAERVYLTLRRRIRDLEMPPGTALRKDELAAEFDVSKAPVHEAITRLADEGLVEVFPQHGSFVALIRPDEVREGLFIRMGLEVEAIRRVAGRKDVALTDALSDNLQRQEEALRSKDLQRFYELDENLHDQIFAAAGSVHVRKFLDSARAPLDRMRRLTLPTGERAEATFREHCWLVDAIKAGDPELASAAMRAHLNAVSEAIEHQLSSLPEMADR